MQANGGLRPNGTVPEAILHPASRSLFSYWNALRGEREAPCRHDLDLRAIAAILPWIGIMDRQRRPKRHCWRLAGTGIARLWGNGLAGSPVAAGWPDVYRRALLRALDGVCERRQPFVARLRAVSADGEALGIEIFAAPVEASDGASTQTMCSVVPFREPDWLGRVALVDVELSTLTAIWLGPLPGEIGLRRGHAAAGMQLKLIQGGRQD